MISIIIATHNRTDKLLRLLNILKGQTYVNFNVIIINDFPEKIKISNYPFSIEILEMGNSDLWWAESVNKGLEYSRKLKSKYILILNDDSIISDNYLHEAVKFQQKYNRIIQGPIVYELISKKIWSVGGLINLPFKGTYHNKLISENENYTKVDWLPGMGTFFSKSYLDEIGYLKSKKYPQYYSDTDYTLSAKSKGYEIVVNHNLILHNESELTGGISKTKLYLKDLKKIFKHKGSPEFYSAKINFLKDHSSNYLNFSISLLFMYTKLLMFIIKKLI